MNHFPAATLLLPSAAVTGKGTREVNLGCRGTSLLLLWGQGR